VSLRDRLQLAERPSLVELGVIDDRDAARLGAVGLGGISVLGVVASLGCLWFPPDAPGLHAAPVLAISLFGLATAAVLAVRPSTFPARALAPTGPIAVALLGLLAYLVGPELYPYVTIFYVWIGASFPFHSRLRSFAQLGFAFVLCAVVFAVQPGHADVVVELEILIGTVGVAAMVGEWVVQRITAAALEERANRHRLEEASTRLEAVNRQKREFLAVTSHELRTPLNAIIGFSEVLGEELYGPLNERQAEYVDDIRSSGQHLLGLIGEVLDVAKVESGRLDLDVTKLDLREVLVATSGLFREQAVRRHVRLDFDIPALGTVEADERKLRQVVVNLLSNAVELTPAGGRVVISARDQGDHIEVAVRDTGPGIPAEDQERIFRAFEQGGQRTGGGTGLGLALARRFVEAHGGRLDVRSQPGAGSTFAFTVGRRLAPVITADAEVQLGPGRVPPSDETMRGTRKVLTSYSGWGAVLASLVVATMAVRHRSIPGYRPAALMIFAGVALALWLVLRRVGPELTVRQYAALFFVYTGLLTGIALMAGPVLAPWGTTAYTWAALATFILLPRRVAFGLLVAIGLFYAVFLRLQPGNYLPVVRWELVMGACACCAVGAMWLMGKLHELTVAEHAARVEVERSWQELERVSRHKSEFLANMSHELRTPLNAIIGFADVLHEKLFGPLNVKQTEYVDDIVEAGRQLLALINDILDLAKADAGRIQLDVQPVAVADLLRGTIEEFACAAVERGLTFDVTVAPAATTVDADPARLRRVISNLVSNAVKFSPDGGRITIDATRDNGEVVVAVRDRGPGIAAVDQSRIFDEFQQVAPAGLAHPGAGLGLALARRFVELHDGRLEVESEPGGGSTFRLALPQAAAIAAGAP
jgi:signal transduction histidine kinase